MKTVSGLEKQSLANCLPRYSILITREELAGVDKRNFGRWAEIFVKDVSDLPKHGRKLLLLYDSYRSHMSLKVLIILREGNVIAYCLLAHTRSKTHPLDLTVFVAFKHYIAANMKGISLVNHHDLFDCFNFCNILRNAYEKSFTPSNIFTGFERAGLWPINAETAGLPQARRSKSWCDDAGGRHAGVVGAKKGWRVGQRWSFGLLFLSEASWIHPRVLV